MICEACGNPAAWHLKSGFNGITGERYKACDRCGLQGPGKGAPDVFWPGHAYKSEALDIEFTSREQKAQYLKDHDIREAGDRSSQTGKTWIEGTRDYRKRQWVKQDQPMIRKVYKDWIERTRR